MKWWITVCVLLSALQGHAQEPWHLWTQHHPYELDAFLTEHLDSLGHYTGMIAGDVFTNDAFRRSIHLMDLDQDGDMDAIYSGFSGAESEYIEFWLATATGLQRQTPMWGEIKEIYGTPGRFFVDVFEPGCCAANYNHHVLYCVEVSRDAIAVGTVKRTATAIAETEPFWSFAEPIPFEVTQAEYHLRLGPEINTTDWLMDSEEPGNAIAVYSTGMRGVALSQATDDTGRVWWYVVMEPTSASDPTYCTGWMSSRFLRVITHD